MAFEQPPEPVVPATEVPPPADVAPPTPEELPPWATQAIIVHITWPVELQLHVLQPSASLNETPAA
jgi:hypothetical protein